MLSSSSIDEKQWAHSPDSINCANINKTRKGTLTIEGLKPVSKIWFRHENNPAASEGLSNIYLTIP